MGGWRVSIRNCQSVSRLLFVRLDPCGATRRMIKRPVYFTRSTLCPLSLWIPLRGCRQHSFLSAGRKPVIFVRLHWLKKTLTHTFIRHAASHTTCAIRGVKPVQMSSLCVAGVQSESCHLIPTAEPCDCSSGPVFVTHKYAITLRLAPVPPDLPDVYFKPRTSPLFMESVQMSKIQHHLQY